MRSAHCQIKKETTAEIITSSCKNQLIDSNRKNNEKKNRLSKSKNKIFEEKTKGKQQIEKTKSNNSFIDSDDEKEIHFDTASEPDVVIEQESPDSRDADCMFCKSPFPQDTLGEMKCLMCSEPMVIAKVQSLIPEYVIFASNLSNFLKLTSYCSLSLK
ncbi:hypothetical protein HHI36_014128 [Cryptolaemus montrouzieri]|uniref:Uncharacterized protein n=1 Tax=Cryptolaemus montrouzieri TaxID=559131 RepID=A0ABD2N1X3_9CUCU